MATEPLDFDDIPEDAIIMSTIQLIQYLNNKGEYVTAFRAARADGSPLPLIDTLGILRLAEDTAFKVCEQ